jgi:NADH dehydrogenase
MEIVKRLAAEGITIRVASRHPDNTNIRQRLGQADNILPVYADVRDEASVADAIEGCDAVVNAVGLYVERGAETFEAVHELGALNVAHQSAVFDVARLVHISGIGADLYSASSYVRARAKGELLVADVLGHATILRPSVLFGPEDKFLNTLARMIRRSPVLPLFGRGQTKLQPVFVGDVAEAVLKVLTNSASQAQTYELGGPRTYSYRALLNLVLSKIKRRRLILPVPFPIWDGLAAITSLLATPPLTPAQVTLMKQNNVVAETAMSFEDLHVKPTALEDILPFYSF